MTSTSQSIIFCATEPQSSSSVTHHFASLQASHPVQGRISISASERYSVSMPASRTRSRMALTSSAVLPFFRMLPEIPRTFIT
ncbi:hypothetical protein DSECCO2_489960 [anaerobic digester metagenome]